MAVITDASMCLSLYYFKNHNNHYALPLTHRDTLCRLLDTLTARNVKTLRASFL